MNPTSKRISAAVLSLALGFTIAGAPMLAPVASAQISAGQVSNVDLDADVSLTINKYQGEFVENDGAGNVPLDDVSFTVDKVQMTNQLKNLGLLPQLLPIHGRRLQLVELVLHSPKAQILVSK